MPKKGVKAPPAKKPGVLGLRCFGGPLMLNCLLFASGSGGRRRGVCRAQEGRQDRVCQEAGLACVSSLLRLLTCLAAS